MGQAPSAFEFENAATAWKFEEKLSQKQRRQRYRCGSRFKTAADCEVWTKDIDEAMKKASEIIPQNVGNLEFLKVKEQRRQERKAAKPPKEGLDEKDKERKQYREMRKRKEFEFSLKSADEELIPTGKYQGNDAINQKVSLVRADITTLELDAIVNAANGSLLGGGGIDGAIHRAAGDNLYGECRTLHGCPTGETKITRGYNLPAKYVLHTVGPQGPVEQELVGCYETIGALILQHKLKTIALCGVSTGIFGYPLYSATHVALRTMRDWLEKDENYKKVDKIVFCTFLEKELECYQLLMPFYFPPPGKSTDDVLANYKTIATGVKVDSNRILSAVMAEEKEAADKKAAWKERMKNYGMGGMGGGFGGGGFGGGMGMGGNGMGMGGNGMGMGGIRDSQERMMGPSAPPPSVESLRGDGPSNNNNSEKNEKN